MKPNEANDTSSAKALVVPKKTSTHATTNVRPIAYLGTASRPDSLPSSALPGSALSLALAQIARLTAVCTAIMLEANPTTSMTSVTRPAAEPKLCSRVVAIGLVSLPDSTAGHQIISS